MSVVALYIVCVVGANWLAEHAGGVGVGFGLHAAVRRCGVTLPVLCSGMVGVVDSLLIPVIALASVTLTPGHLLGKAYGVLDGMILTAATRPRP